MSNEPVTERGRLYPPEVVCPRCGARPALRASGAWIEVLRAESPATRVASYRCQRRGCGTIYDILAAAFQRVGRPGGVERSDGRA